MESTKEPFGEKMKRLRKEKAAIRLASGIVSTVRHSTKYRIPDVSNDQVMDLLSRIKTSLKTPGRSHMERYLSGEQVYPKQMIVAKCADCCAYYVDGRQDCEEITCPLYPFMPYRLKKPERKGSNVE